MRSSTIFLIFGGLVVAIMLFTGLSRRSNVDHPVNKAVSAFLQAVNAQDAQSAGVIRQALDETIAKATWADADGHEKLVSINFPDYTPPQGGAFTKLKQIQWTHRSLTALQIDTNIDTNPVIDDDNGMASVIMADGSTIYLHRVDGAWKIVYIAKKDEGQHS